MDEWIGQHLCVEFLCPITNYGGGLWDRNNQVGWLPVLSGYPVFNLTSPYQHNIFFFSSFFFEEKDMYPKNISNLFVKMNI
jgi:hypothetical protein